jgi:Sulfotransferase family
VTGPPPPASGRRFERAESLLTAASAATGLDDFGDDSFRKGLDRFVWAVDQGGRLTTLGEVAVRDQIVRLLSQRLQIEDWYRRHPEIENEPIDSPLIGVTIPRTGSTALSFLLAEDPSARSLRSWEAFEPCPPPSTVRGPDPRLERALAVMERRDETSSRLAALVPSSPTGPMETQCLMALDFKAFLFQGFAHVPSYSKWLIHDADLTSTYRYERRTLKLLQWGKPRQPWRLKCPTNLLFMSYLAEAFPDARFVMTHRDPTEVVVSVSDLYVEVRRMYGRDIHLGYLGAMNLELLAVGLRRTLEFRDGGADDRFYDIDFRAMQRDPIGEVRGLYAWLGEPVSEEFEAGMKRWWQDNAASREKNVHPDPATFGLDLDQIRPLFADYTRRIRGWTTH